MAENVTVSNNSGNAGTDYTVATDDVIIGTNAIAQVQYVKLVDGTVGGTAVVAATANGLKVDGSAVTQPVSFSTPLAVSQSGAWTVTANIGTTNGLALDATLTGGTAKVINRGGAKGTTAAADLTSTASGANHQGLDVALYDASGNQLGLAASPVRTDPTGTTTQPISGTVTANQGTAAAASGAWPAKVTDGTNVAAVKAASTAAAAADPSAVVALSPNSPLPAGTNALGTVTANIGTSGSLALDATLTGGSAKAIPAAGTANGATPYKLISAATTNATSVKASAGTLYTILALNLNATANKFLKFYDKASAPTVGTDTPVLTIPLPFNAGAAGVSLPVSVGMKFASGIAFAITANLADSDNTAVAASEVVVNLAYA